MVIQKKTYVCQVSVGNFSHRTRLALGVKIYVPLKSLTLNCKRVVLLIIKK